MDYKLYVMVSASEYVVSSRLQGSDKIFRRVFFAGAFRVTWTIMNVMVSASEYVVSSRLQGSDKIFRRFFLLAL